MSEAKKKRAPGAGRPAKPAGERLHVVPIRFSQSMLDLIDDARARRTDPVDRSQIIREFVAQGLDRADTAATRKRRGKKT